MTTRLVSDLIKTLEACVKVHAQRLGVLDWEGFQRGLDTCASNPADDNGLVKIQGPYLAYLADFLRLKAAESSVSRAEIDRLTGQLIEAENTLGVIAQDGTDYPQRTAEQYFEDANRGRGLTQRSAHNQSTVKTGGIE